MTTLSSRTLPLLTPSHPGGRSAMTCQYRCGDACAQPVPNPSTNAYFGDVVRTAMTRRAALKAGGATAGLVGLTTWTSGPRPPPRPAPGAASTAPRPTWTT